MTVVDFQKTYKEKLVKELMASCDIKNAMEVPSLKKITLNIAVPIGKIRLVVYDDRADSSSFKKLDEFILGPNDQYALITIPPMVWSGFQKIGATESLLANYATIPHNPDETDQLNMDDASIEFDWSAH